MEQPLAAEHHLPAPYMLWGSSPHTVAAFMQMPTGYEVRLYQPGDEYLLHALFANEGWSIDEHHWQDYLDHVVSNHPCTCMHS